MAVEQVSNAAHLRALTFFSLLSRVLIAALIVSSTYLLNVFDSSPSLILSSTTPPWISSLLRWDVFHFTHVAQQGHTYEHAWAFFPALPFIMRVSGQLLSRAGLSSPDMTAPLLGGAVLAALLDSTRVLYRLSLHHLRSPSAAFLAVALSLLSSSPATLRFTPSSEPFFTYCSYKGMWACARARWFSASVWFALASAFRSNGIFLSGFIMWGMLVAPFLSDRKDLVSVYARVFHVAHGQTTLRSSLRQVGYSTASFSSRSRSFRSSITTTEATSSSVQLAWTPPAVRGGATRVCSPRYMHTSNAHTGTSGSSSTGRCPTYPTLSLRCPSYSMSTRSARSIYLDCHAYIHTCSLAARPDAERRPARPLGPSLHLQSSTPLRSSSHRHSCRTSSTRLRSLSCSHSMHTCKLRSGYCPRTHWCTGQQHGCSSSVRGGARLGLRGVSCGVQ